MNYWVILIWYNSRPMEKILKHCSNHSMLISLIMLLQGCVVYHKTPVSLDQAARAGTKAKIVKADGSLAKYKYITEINGEYYGVSKKSGMWVETPTNINPKSEVFLKNVNASKWATWGMILTPALALGIFAATLVILDESGALY